MPLSWNEIKSRAIAFSQEWQDTTSEHAEAKSFWDSFFNVFGVNRRRIASFEVPVEKSDGQGGFIDLLWKGNLLVEHKSKGKSLDKAFDQAKNYFKGLKDKDLPRYILVSDFARFRLYDLDQDVIHEFNLNEFYKNIELFGFVAGYQSQTVFEPHLEINIKAVEKLGLLHDQLKSIGYDGHVLEVFLVRILFCLFAENTEIFKRYQFQQYILQRTNEDGSDLGLHLTMLFQVLNTSSEKRLKTLDSQLNDFIYINGNLFAEMLPVSAFDRKMRELLLDCCKLDWAKISPAIFGSLFQSIMDKNTRRNLGAHYTSEENILKALNPLFLNDFRQEFYKIKHNKKLLQAFHEKLASLKIFDPACGCGNFLVIAYRELRLLELEILKVLYQSKEAQQLTLDIDSIVKLNVDQFFGIEIEEFPAQIAQVALWLVDHQMNLLISETFGLFYARLPLKKSAHILHDNALHVNWAEFINPEELSYIIGNPPFIGKSLQTEQQKREIKTLFENNPNAGILDYVCCWYKKAVDFIQENPKIRVVFVSTNSIIQGEQVAVLWEDFFKLGIFIHFAYRTFSWFNEAKANAQVHVVIISFALHDKNNKTIFEHLNQQVIEIPANFINGYLIDAPAIFLKNRTQPICNVSPMILGSTPNDNGLYLFTTEEKDNLIHQDERLKKYFKKIVGSREFINNIERWCLWFKDASPAELKQMPIAMDLISKVKQYRQKSSRKATVLASDFPHLFAELRHIDAGNYLLIPRHSSERRNYLPIGFLDVDTISTDANLIIPNATLYDFGILSSKMHIEWIKTTCGRIKSDFRYSARIVYNNFVWCNPTQKQKEKIESLAQNILNMRLSYSDCSLADLYDPLTAPNDLMKEHVALDKTVDSAYGFKGEDDQRIQFLFELYEKTIKK